MIKNSKYQTITIAVLIVTILVMSVGFAVFNADLDLKTTATVSQASWKIQFDTATFNKTLGSVLSSPEEVITENSVTSTIKLEKPGDFYEYTINTKNSGTFNAKLNTITMSTLTDKQQQYLSYKVFYKDVPYTVTTSDLASATSDNLAPGASEAIKVRVEYLLPELETNLPSTDDKIILTTTLTYQQQ